MDLQSEKLDLIQWLIQLSDEKLIGEIKALRMTRVNQPELISEEERVEIEEGVKDLEDGNTFTHRQVMDNVGNRFANLLK